jgi:hypothetical protein
MKYVVAAVGALVLIFFGCQYVGERIDQKEQALCVDNFYKNVIALDVRGAPSKDEIEILSPFISTKLRDSLLQASVAEEKHALDMKGDEVPLFEGPMFVGGGEGASRIKAIKREVMTGQITFLVTLQMMSSHDKDPNNDWKDRAILIQDKGKWVVDDLVFLIKEGNVNNRTLSQSFLPKY